MKYNYKVISTLIHKSLKPEIMKVWKKEWDDIPIELRNKLNEIVDDIILHIIKVDIDIKRFEEIEDYELCQMTMELLDSYIYQKIDEIISLKPGLNRERIFQMMKRSQKFFRDNC